MANSKQDNIYNVIGRNVKKYRTLKGWTQRKLAESIPVSESFIAKLESVTYQTVSVDMLEKFAIALNIDIRCFFDRDV